MHHIGIITRNISADAATYAALGYERSGEIIEDALQNNRLLFMENPQSGEVLELIEPVNESSSVYKLPTGYAHICYEVEDLDAQLAQFKRQRLGVVFTEKISAPAFNGRYVVFAMLKNKTMIEFLQGEK